MSNKLKGAGDGRKAYRDSGSGWEGQFDEEKLNVNMDHLFYGDDPKEDSEG